MHAYSFNRVQRSLFFSLREIEKNSKIQARLWCPISLLNFPLRQPILLLKSSWWIWNIIRTLNHTRKGNTLFLKSFLKSPFRLSAEFSTHIATKREELQLLQLINHCIYFHSLNFPSALFILFYKECSILGLASAFISRAGQAWKIGLILLLLTAW